MEVDPREVVIAVVEHARVVTDNHPIAIYNYLVVTDHHSVTTDNKKNYLTQLN